MAGSRLTPLQERILRALASLSPPWTLTGGGALAGIHTGHRTTRDLDLFWRQRRELGDTAREAAAALQAAGFNSTTLRTTPLFAELRVERAGEVCIVDLVAEPMASIEPPQRASVAGALINVDTPHEILVNKLTALLGRSEPRDLWDVTVLVDLGVDLERAIADAPRKDAGFSPLTLAWVLKNWDFHAMTRALGWNEATVLEVGQFQGRLVDVLTTGSRPE